MKHRGRMISGWCVVFIVSLGALGCSNNKRHVYDFSTSLERANSRLTEQVSSRPDVAVAVDVHSELPDPRHIGYSLRKDSLSIRLGTSPVTNGEADRDITEYLHEATVAVARHRGVGITAEGEAAPVRLLLTCNRFEFLSPDAGDAAGITRTAVFEGYVAVVQGKDEVYSRRIAVEAKRDFAWGSSTGLGFIQGDMAMIAHNREETEGVQALFHDVLTGYQDQVLDDEDLWSAVIATGHAAAGAPR